MRKAMGRQRSIICAAVCVAYNLPTIRPMPKGAGLTPAELPAEVDLLRWLFGRLAACDQALQSSKFNLVPLMFSHPLRTANMPHPSPLT